jgi:sugar-specific transcriptional regulator TrmB
LKIDQNFGGSDPASLLHLKEILGHIGLSEIEITIYLILLKNGPLKAMNLTKILATNKPLVYRCLKKLESNDFVSSTLTFPTYFEATPFEKIVDKMIDAKQFEINNLKNNRDIIANLKNVGDMLNVQNERFIIIEGLKTVHSRLLDMCDATKNELLFMLDNYSMPEYDIVNNITTLMNSLKKRKVKVKFITSVNKDNLDALTKIVRKTKMDKGCVEGRHTDLPLGSFPTIVISDRNQVLIGIDLWANMTTSIRRQGYRGMYINNEVLIRTLALLFDTIWINSVDLKTKIPFTENRNPKLIVD